MMFSVLSVVLCFQIIHTLATPSGSDQCPTIIKKRDWGGQASTNVQYSTRPLEYVIIHHTATPECQDEMACTRRLVNMQNYHMNELGLNDITYNFLIGSNGQIYEGVGWHKVGSHSPGWNAKSIGIAFIGDFRTKVPNKKMLDAAKDLILCSVEMGELKYQYKLLGARSVKKTESPGGALYREIQNWRGFTRRIS
ncbi:PGRPS1 [Trypoxylus dichotomus]